VSVAAVAIASPQGSPDSTLAARHHAPHQDWSHRRRPHDPGPHPRWV